MRAYLISDEKYPDTTVEFGATSDPNAVSVELTPDEVRLVRRFQRLEEKYDDLCDELWKRSQQ